MLENKPMSSVGIETISCGNRMTGFLAMMPTDLDRASVMSMLFPTVTFNAGPHCRWFPTVLILALTESLGTFCSFRVKT